MWRYDSEEVRGGHELQHVTGRVRLISTQGALFNGHPLSTAGTYIVSGMPWEYHTLSDGSLLLIEGGGWVYEGYYGWRYTYYRYPASAAIDRYGYTMYDCGWGRIIAGSDKPNWLPALTPEAHPITRSQFFLASWPKEGPAFASELSGECSPIRAFRMLDAYGCPKSYWGLAKGQAFLQAAHTIPVMNTNNLQNLQAAFQLLRGVLSRNLTISLSPQNVWLAYRYSYMTTKQDMEDIAEFCRLTSHYKAGIDAVHGSYLDENGVQWRCTLRMHNREVSGIKGVSDQLYQLGLNPVDPKIIWDMIPYSFILDWIFPIGSSIETICDRKWFTTEHWDIDSIWYSMSYTTSVDDPSGSYSYNVYNRWSEISIPDLNDYYYVEDHHASLRTSIMRIIDGICLVRH